MIASIPHSDENEAVWKQLEPHLDQAVAALPEADRQAILLRFYEKKPLLEIGQHLGLSEEAAKKRVSRAVQKMRDFLVRRDVAVGGTLLGGLLAEHTVQAVPVPWRRLCQKPPHWQFRPQPFCHDSPRRPSMPGAGPSTKITAGVTLSLCAFCVVVFALPPHAPVIAHATSEPESVRAKVAPQKEVLAAAPEAYPTPAALAAQASPSATTNAPIIHFRVVAKDSGEPVSGALLAVNTVGDDGRWKQRFDLSTDENGGADVPYPPGTGRLDIGVIASGWAASFATWRTDSDPEFPSEYTLRVDRMTNSMGGRLVDDQGQPVANAVVELAFGSSDGDQEENPRERPGFVSAAPVTKSDNDGWWTCAVVGPNAWRFPPVEIRHPDFALTKIEQPNADLWSGKLITTMNRKVTMVGRIMTEDGTPVSGAHIDHNPAFMSEPVTESDSQGWFTLEGLPPGPFDFIVTAPGFAQDYIKTSLKVGMEPVEVRLQTGKTLRLRLIDEDGNPVANATAAATGPAGGYMPGIYWNAQSGADGRVEWTCASATNWVNICAYKSAEFAMSQMFLKQVDDQEHVIRLHRMLTVTGRVIDARTGELVHGEIKAFPGYDPKGWFRGDTWRSTNGTFQVHFNENNSTRRFSIEAPGYAPFVSDWLRPDSTAVFDVRLQPVDSSKP